ncbi:MAG: putative beta-barrel porin 2 [Verrucomicrobiota bacterium]
MDAVSFPSSLPSSPLGFRRWIPWLLGILPLVPCGLRAQESPRPSVARQKEAQPSVAGDYNLKAGPVLFNFSAGFGVESVDNVRLTDGIVAKKESDLILTPSLGVDIRWQFTKLNAFRFRSTASYAKYLDNPELDTNALLLSPDSELSFDIRFGDFKLTFRDQFSYQQDPIGAGNLSATARFGRFTNDAGLTLLWDLNDVLLRLSYDRVNLQVIGTGPDDPNSRLSRATDQLGGQATLLLSDALSCGIEGTAALSTYAESPENDFARLTAGPFLNLQITPYTKLYASAGLMQSSYKNSVAAAPQNPGAIPNDRQSFYGSLNITHRLNRYFSDSISVGRENQLGLLAQETRTDFVRLTGILQLTPFLSLNSQFFYEAVELSSQAGSETYERWGTVLGTSYRFTRHLQATASYQFTEKTAEIPNQDYTQNRIGLSFLYDF